MRFPCGSLGYWFTIIGLCDILNKAKRNQPTFSDTAGRHETDTRKNPRARGVHIHLHCPVVHHPLSARVSARHTFPCPRTGMAISCIMLVGFPYPDIRQDEDRVDTKQKIIWVLVGIIVVLVVVIRGVAT